jgi:LysM repeat protein
VSGRTTARVAAPAAFLLAVTIAVLLIRAGLRHHEAAPATTATTVTTTATHHKHRKKAHPKPAAPAAGVYVTVQSGDTFYSIATRAGLSLDRLKALNPGVSPYAIHIGQRIRVK